MRLVGISAVAVAIILLVSLSSGAELEAVAPTISASQGAALPERRAFNYIQRTPPEVVVERTDEPKRVVRSEPVVRALPERTYVPPPPPAPAELEELVPTVPPAVSACVGQYVGTACTYTEGTSRYVGTCMTPAFSPVICVSHSRYDH